MEAMQPAGILSSAGNVTELERLFEITRDVLGASSLDAAMTSLARGVQDLFGWRYVTMVAAEEPNGELRRRVMLGYPEDVVAQRLYEKIDREAFTGTLRHGVRFFEDCYFFPAEREMHWDRSIYVGPPEGSAREYPSQWHERDALVLTLHDRDGVMMGYMSPDAPINGEIPNTPTLRAMQVFVNLMGMALANARSQSRLQYEATHDSLTGLPNRTVFSLELARALEAVQRGEDEPRAVLYFDLDEFKSINDTMGHLAGDEVLKEAAARLCSVDERFIVSRMAGDEFALLLSDATPERIAHVLDVLHAVLRRPYRVADREFIMTVSIGVAPIDRQYTSIAEVLRDADTAMYRAKHEGRNRSAFFEPSMHQEALRRLSLRMHLRSAIERNEFVILYQPIVTLSNGRIAGVEALLRWNHPEEGYLSPSAFLPLAEEMGLMKPVGQFVLESACKQLREWQERFPDTLLPMNVNLSVQEVLHPELPGFVGSLLSHYGIGPGRVTLEITETSILQSEARAHGILSELRAAGARLCVDDFGTGYSSLRYIRTLPIDALKIDQSFSADVSDEKGRQIVELLVRLGDALNLTVTAEGIETRRQAEDLFALGCRFGQGTYFHPPVPAALVTSILERSRQAASA